MVVPAPPSVDQIDKLLHAQCSTNKIRCNCNIAWYCKKGFTEMPYFLSYFFVECMQDSAWQLQVVLMKLSNLLQSEQKWKQLAELAISKCQFGLAQECLHHAQDYGGLLLLATASGNASMVAKLAEGAERDGKNNVAFMTYFLQGK